MVTITYTRAAKCKDCRYCNRFKQGKLTRHRCSNTESKKYATKYSKNTIRLNDLVCENWKL